MMSGQVRHTVVSCTLGSKQYYKVRGSTMQVSLAHYHLVSMLERQLHGKHY